MSSYVYVITNKLTKEQYVGKSDNPAKRWEAHKKKIKERLRYPLYHALNEYGVENFTFEILKECESSDAALIEENNTIVEFRKLGIKLYNLNDGGFGGKNPTKETRQHISDCVKESLKSADLSFYKDENYRQHLSESVKLSWNKDITKQKHCDGNRRAWADTEIREKMIAAMNTPQSKERRRLAHLGKKYKRHAVQFIIPQDLQDRVRQLRNENKTLGEIMIETGLSGYAVRKILTNNFTKRAC